mmetsp:Transcript_17653/g.29991  ORF Transcript_17653/g.29991 Transcript_17653/m.29991 type:complete len:234 (-) Transcript_17653:271-972(-)
MTQNVVQVTAPSDLMEGYILQVTQGGETVSVRVPVGGVKEGQSFLGEVVEPGSGGGGAPAPPAGPEGKWKDGICDCCARGCCHPACCLGFWCSTLAMAQVMTRFNLTWIGRPNENPVNKTFRITAFILIGYIVASIVVGAIAGALNAQFLVSILEILWIIYIVVAMSSTRRAVREHYNIPEQTCSGCEDCCCAFWCTGCTVCQMLRHSADYDQYPAACCTETGLPPNAPQTVV